MPALRSTWWCRFQPARFGAHSATLTIFSNDPSGAKTVNVTGVAAGSAADPDDRRHGQLRQDVCGVVQRRGVDPEQQRQMPALGHRDRFLVAEFLVPEVCCIRSSRVRAIPSRLRSAFNRRAWAPKSATITVTSDDPLGPRTIAVSGIAPPGKLAVTGSTIFGAVHCDRRVLRTIAICNVGDCDLHVTEVKLKHRRRHLRLINNPFPATLRPGSCLDLTLQYVAREREPRCSELIIHSDDPETPVKCLEVIAYTVWDCCTKPECCEEHRKPCCSEEHGGKSPRTQARRGRGVNMNWIEQLFHLAPTGARALPNSPSCWCACSCRRRCSHSEAKPANLRRRPGILRGGGRGWFRANWLRFVSFA